MVKKALLLLSASACLAGTAQAQTELRCHADEVHQEMLKWHPEIALREQQLKAEIQAQLLNMNLSKFKTTNFSDTMYVPLVFHIVHDYGNEYSTDTMIYRAVREINEMFNSWNDDTTNIIAPYAGNIPGTKKNYKARSRIIFKLATKDPQGNPTHGITRRRTHHTYAGSDQAKLDGWPNQSYMNIWIVRDFGPDHAGAAAYAYKPPVADFRPWADGVIGKLQQNTQINYDNTLAHELGHTLNLDHPWGGTNSPGVACGDDNIDDTPPTYGHPPPGGGNGCTPGNLYDTRCIYTAATIGLDTLDQTTDIADALTGVGIKFAALDKIFLDSVYFYPTAANQPYTIVLRHNGTVVNSHSGITTGSHNLRIMGRDTTQYLPSYGYSDNLNNTGISFQTRDTININSLMFRPVDSGEAYQIVLKHNGSIINSYSGVTFRDTAANLNWTEAPVNFGIPQGDTTDTFSIEFAVNPGVYRDSVFGNLDTSFKLVKILNQVSTGKYNYFFRWNVETYDYAQVAKLNFRFEADPDTSSYSLEFSQNPGARRDAATLMPADSFLFGAIHLNDAKDTNGYYNYFYNWHFSFGDYKKDYPVAVYNALFDDTLTSPSVITVNYPDTVNSQNVMDYTYCSKMFTYLQAVHMRAALSSTTANRSNLSTPQNLQATGALDPFPDLAPIADFSVPIASSFVCPGQMVTFSNRSWNDTIKSVEWTFPSTAQNPTSNMFTQLFNRFYDPGWATISLMATSDLNGVVNGGTNTITKSDLVYVADPNPVNPVGYFQEFNQNGDLSRYPIFNYFNNNTKWEVLDNVGYMDNTSIRYRNFDTRVYPINQIGTPRGDFDDFFTPAFDLDQLSGAPVYLNFFSSGAFRTNVLTNMNDTLEIAMAYCNNNSISSWTTVKTLTRLDVGNLGSRNADVEFVPGGFWDWKGQSIEIKNVPANADGKVYFRIRFKPGVDLNKSTLNYQTGTGHHFYLDRIHLSNWTTDVTELEQKETGIVLAPNPTTGSTNVIVKDSKSATAQIQVTDITGKVVFTKTAALNGTFTSIEIPENAVKVKGVYLVQVNTGTTKFTEKLVVY